MRKKSIKVHYKPLNRKANLAAYYSDVTQRLFDVFSDLDVPMTPAEIKVFISVMHQKRLIIVRQ